MQEQKRSIQPPYTVGKLTYMCEMEAKNRQDSDRSSSPCQIVAYGIHDADGKFKYKYQQQSAL